MCMIILSTKLYLRVIAIIVVIIASYCCFVVSYTVISGI